MDNDDQDEDMNARDYNGSYDASIMSNPYAQDLAREALVDAEQTIQQLQSEMFLSDRQTAADKLEIGALKLQVQELQTAKAAADAATEAVWQEWRSLSHELTALQKQNAEKDTELTARRTAHRDVEVESKKLQQEVLTMTTELTALRKKVTQLEPELEQARKKITGLTTDNKRLDTKLKEEEKARQSEFKAHKKKDEEISKAKQVAAEKEEKLVSRVNDLSSQLIAVLKSTEELHATGDGFANAARTASEEISRLCKENKTMSTKLQAFQKMLNHNPQTHPSYTSSHSNAVPSSGASVSPASGASSSNSVQPGDSLVSSYPANAAHATQGETRDEVVADPGAKRQKGSAENENKDQNTENTVQDNAKKQSLPPRAHCDLDGCTQPGMYICSSCKSAGYCGLSHQKEHWRVHRKTCANDKQFREKELARSINYADGYAMGQAVGAFLDANGSL